MKRKIYAKLLDWKKNGAGKTALLVDGARRVGKSYVAEEFGRREYESFCLIDFSKPSKKIRELFELYLDDLDTFFFYLQQRMNVRLVPGRSLVVFDEVQLYPAARAALKHLVADGRFHYLETGSLVSLKRNVKNILIPSEERHIQMNPMDFEEFLWAMGNETAVPLARDCFEKRRALGEASHRQLMDWFRQYMVVGGMPQAVEAFADGRNLEEADRRKRDILALYRADIRKYAGRLVDKIERTFDEIPSLLQRHERKVRWSALREGARMRSWEDAFIWLREAMMVNIAQNATEPTVGLKANLDRTTIKCYMGDTGLLVSHTFDENELASGGIQRRLLCDDIDANGGMLAENAVAQMLTASGHKLFFYSRGRGEGTENRMEVDFLVTRADVGRRRNIHAVEVKSGRSTKHVSLDKFRNKFSRGIGESFLLHTKDVAVKDGIVHLPLYMGMFL
jgi:hypothetical protein